MEVLPGPPTGALLWEEIRGIHKAYRETGKGSGKCLRSRAEIEETKTGRERIVVATGFPYTWSTKPKVHEHIVRWFRKKTGRTLQPYIDRLTVEGVPLCNRG